MNTFLDYFFSIFHSCFVLFNLTGWAWKMTKRLHLITISITLISWFGLGVFYGWGYCPFTDWHWKVKYNLGQTDLPASYIKYYADKLTGFSWNAMVVDTVVVVLGILVFILSCWFNLRRRNSSPLK